jgi:predicted regulator of Ras-like GTPase activity (Roadblock/LC7/MglB family)
VTEVMWDDGSRDDPLQRALREILDESIGVSGVLVATIEGLLVAGEFVATAAVASYAEAETIAAMAASTVGLGQQFSDRLALGSSTGSIVHSSGGCLAVQRVGETGVLVLFGGDGLNVARLNLSVRQALPRVRDVLVGMGLSHPAPA